MMKRHQQRYESGVAGTARSLAVALAAPANTDGGTMRQTVVASLDATAGAAAREREAAIRSIGLDGIVLGGATIRRLRRAAGLSSDELAARIGYSGALVRAWEAGRRNCPPYLYLPIVEAISTARRDQASRIHPFLSAERVLSQDAA